MAIGIYAGSFKQQKPLAEIQPQIAVVKQYGYGYALFCGKTSLGILRLANRTEKEKYLKAILHGHGSFGCWFELIQVNLDFT